MISFISLECFKNITFEQISPGSLFLTRESKKVLSKKKNSKNKIHNHSKI